MSSERTESGNIDPAALERRRRVIRWLIRNIGFRVGFKFERVNGVENLPREGAAILMMNHLALLDPLYVMGCLPRNVVPLVKAEGYRIPLLASLMSWYRCIPVQRGEVDRHALRGISKALEAGDLVLMAPEGTRHPALKQPRPGVAYVAWKSGAPVVPVALQGSEGLPTLNPARWLRPGATVSLGQPFRFRSTPGRPSHEQLQCMIDEAMYLLAAMLPEALRGEYADLGRATTSTIEFV